ncbi:Protein phosphatase methylesterase 1 [Paecilomyces lecythidis]|uniref:Protein phosphatase methylesterase 1 n=1 Tax=Paecilomyces lecythidis TaxID=3004212 RepID=A0ABR3Y9T9_9EURO
MSDLQRSFAKSRLARLPPEPPPIFDEAQEDALAGYQRQDGGHDDDSSSASSASSTGTVVPSPSKHLFARGRGSSSKQGAASLNWADYFTQELSLEEDVDDLHIVHHVYLIPPSRSAPLFVTHHGAGSSGLSFAVCAEEIRKILPDAGILSLDARWHGSTTVTRKSEHQDSANSDVEVDLRLETLSRDLVFIVRETQKKMGWETLPDLVLVGHSLGGAVVVDAAKKGELGTKVLAYAVLDVVEGIFR